MWNLGGYRLLRIFCAVIAVSATLVPAPAAAGSRLVLSEASFGAGEWTYILQGSGPTAVIDGRRLDVTLPATSMQTAQPGIISGGAVSRCQVRGDFDMQVSFRLGEWPSQNGVQVVLGDGNLQDIVARSSEPSFGQETYLAYVPPNGASIPTSDLSGALRLSRQGGTVTGFYRSEDGWTKLLSAPAQTGDAYIVLYAWSDDIRFGHKGVSVAFSHFRLTQGELICA